MLNGYDYKTHGLHFLTSRFILLTPADIGLLIHMKIDLNLVLNLKMLTR